MVAINDQQKYRHTNCYYTIKKKLKKKKKKKKVYVYITKFMEISWSMLEVETFVSSPTESLH